MTYLPLVSKRGCAARVMRFFSMTCGNEVTSSGAASDKPPKTYQKAFLFSPLSFFLYYYDYFLLVRSFFLSLSHHQWNVDKQPTEQDFLRHLIQSSRTLDFTIFHRQHDDGFTFAKHLECWLIARRP